VFKFTFPQWIPALAITQPFDYQVVNTAIRYGYQMFVGPGHFTQRLDTPLMRPLAEYLQEANRLRAAWSDIIFRGEFRDTLGVEVEAPDGIGYSVHRHPETGRQACVLVNFLEEELTVSLSFTDSGSGSAQLQIPFAPLERISLPGEVSIPGRRFALVVED
jgi:hypothetical protein